MNIFDLSEKRTAKQAFIFYLVYMLIGIVLGGLICGAAAVLYCVFHMDACQVSGYDIGRSIGTKMGLISVFAYHLLLGIGIVCSKGLWKKVDAIFLTILASVLAIFGGCLIGLIAIAVLTTYDNKSLPALKDEQNEQDEDATIEDITPKE